VGAGIIWLGLDDEGRPVNVIEHRGAA